MKKIILILVIGCAVTLPGCKKDFLNLQPQGQINYNTFFTSRKDADKTLIGIYTVLGWDEVHGVNDWAFGDVASDDSQKGGESAADQPEMGKIDNFTLNGGNSFVSGTWTDFYIGIFRANLLLSRINDIKDDALTTPVKNRIIGETKFLRAYFYFRLNMMFNGVPLITTLLPKAEYQQPRASAQEIWSLIEQDLTEAIPNLPHKNIANADMQYDPTRDMGRVTTGAAEALLCKAYIFQKKWAEAKSAAEIVINSGDYSLETDYSVIHDLEHENGVESIFEVQQGVGFVTDYDMGWGNGDLGTLMNIYFLSRKAGGWGFNCPTKDLFDEFEIGDVRRSATIARNGDNLPYGLTKYNTTQSPTKMCPRKYVVPREKIGAELCEGPSNIRVIRYADVLLWHAEACAHLNQDALAETSIMLVRNRAGLTTMAPDAQYPTLLDKIYHERRVELALEGHRFFDLVRTGQAAAKLASLGFTAGKNEYFPIPVTEIQLSGDKIIQNPGY